MTLLQNPKRNTLEWLKEGYRYAGIVFLTAFLLFIGLNLLAALAIKTKRANPVFDGVSPAVIEILAPLYPKLNRGQIHDLWKESTNWPFIYHPYTQHRLKPGKGKYIHIDKAGFRHVRQQSPWPAPESGFTIFMFGGSTTFGNGVPNEETIASHLQDLIRTEGNADAHIYNFGQGAFFSTQERILFEELLTAGHHPDMVIFIDGINECALDEPLHSDQIRQFYEGKRFLSLNRLPAVHLISRIISRVKSPAAPERANGPETAGQMAARYLENKKMIEALASSYGFRPVFVWQPAPLFKYDITYQPFLTPRVLLEKQFILEEKVYAFMEQIKNEEKLDGNFLWLADMQEHVKKPLYVDRVHYSPEMSQKIAAEIYGFIKPLMRPREYELPLPVST